MIRVLVPDLPTADELLPYLRRIDETKICCNHGPLVQELEDRISEWKGTPTVAVSSGTAALELALRALNLPAGSGVLVPSVTFVATGLAVLNAGLIPIVCDVDEDTALLCPQESVVFNRGRDTAINDLFNKGQKYGPPRIYAAIPVAAFGMPVPVTQWEKFARDTGCSVVIDAAGALPTQQVSHESRVLTCFSLHGTKPITAGEGGLVCGVRAPEVKALAEFGHTNAKLSEYAAAVALASLVRYHQFFTHAAWPQHLFNRYAQAVSQPKHGSIAAFLGHDSLFCINFENRSSAILAKQLMARGIETRRWYAPYLHERIKFSPFCTGEYPVSSTLSKQLLGLPFHRFLTGADIGQVCLVLKELV